MKPYYEDDLVTLYHGDCLDVLRELPDASVDAVVTDPPYGLEFMGKEWDAPWKQGADVHAEARTRRADEMDDENKRRYIATSVNKFVAGAPFQEWCQLWTAECLRVLKPGGHILAFGGTRTFHRLACAVEDAGFEIRDSIAWLYGSGFPKSRDVSKAIDAAQGVEGERVPYIAPDGKPRPTAPRNWRPEANDRRSTDRSIPATDAARTWQGWGTALKPAFEPVVVARKPLAGTVAANVLTHGTGALNVDGCRIGTADHLGRPQGTMPQPMDWGNRSGDEPFVTEGNPTGRWPANVVLDESQAAALDEQSGELTSGGDDKRGGCEFFMVGDSRGEPTGHAANTGGASRFFYTAKAASDERVRVAGIAHPTVKPLSLMRWLVRLVTPPGGVVLEPFAGSGTTVEACILEGLRCIAIEREADYLPLIVQRINRRRDPVAAVKATEDDGGLFDLLGEEPA